MFTLAFNSVSLSQYAYPKCRRELRFNLNSLFDQEERFLYGNDHFKALIRRIHNKHPHLIN